jgi:hypothetical protein
MCSLKELFLGSSNLSALYFLGVYSNGALYYCSILLFQDCVGRHGKRRQKKKVLE